MEEITNSSSNSSFGFHNDSNDHENNNTPSAWRSALLIFSPCLTAPFSVFGSGCILYMILRSYRKTLARPQHRILLGMSFFDLIFTVPILVNPLLIPQHDSHHMWGAKGNSATCTFQAVTAQFSMGVAAYNAALSFYFFCAICLRVSDRVFQQRVEVYLHTGIGVFLTTIITVGLVKRLYNFRMAWCYIAAYPPGCEDDPNTECTRGSPSQNYIWALNSVWLLLFLVVHVVSHTGIFVAIRRQTLQMKRYDHWWAVPNHHANGDAMEENNNHDIHATLSRERSSTFSSSHMMSSTVHLQRAHKRIWAAATQSLLYLVAFLLTWFGTLLYPLNISALNDSLAFAVIVQTITPLQGFWNFLVYLRPQLLRVRARHPEFSLWQHFRLAFAYESSADAGKALLKELKKQQKEKQRGQHCEQDHDLPDIPSSSLSDDTNTHARNEDSCHTIHFDPALDFVANHNTPGDEAIGNSSNKRAEEKQDVEEPADECKNDGDHDDNNDDEPPDMLPTQQHDNNNSEWSWRVW